MSTKVGSESQYSFNLLRWLFVFASIAGGVFANVVYSEQPVLYRVLGLVVIASIAFFVAINTRQGSAVWMIVKESRTELRKVVWPTKKETNQTTLIVVVLVIIMAFILWGLDSLFGKIASLIIG